MFIFQAEKNVERSKYATITDREVDKLSKDQLSKINVDSKLLNEANPRLLARIRHDTGNDFTLFSAYEKLENGNPARANEINSAIRKYGDEKWNELAKNMQSIVPVQTASAKELGKTMKNDKLSLSSEAAKFVLNYNAGEQVSLLDIRAENPTATDKQIVDLVAEQKRKILNSKEDGKGEKFFREYQSRLMKG